MILVTGASDGIGFACARELVARTGASVLITGRDRSKLDRARSELGCSAMVCDQSREADVAALVAVLDTQAIEGAILTVGINPAYSEGPRRLHALSAATIEQTVRTNCIHAMRLTGALLDRFRRLRGGVLIWIGSQAQGIGLPGAGLYCATKSFLAGLARTAHHEYADRGIRVHLAHPGIVRTPRTASVADAFAQRHGLAVAEAPDIARQIVDLYCDGDPCAVEVNLC